MTVGVRGESIIWAIGKNDSKGETGGWEEVLKSRGSFRGGGLDSSVHRKLATKVRSPVKSPQEVAIWVSFAQIPAEA